MSQALRRSSYILKGSVEFRPNFPLPYGDQSGSFLGKFFIKYSRQEFPEMLGRVVIKTIASVGLASRGDQWAGRFMQDRTLQGGTSSHFTPLYTTVPLLHTCVPIMPWIPLEVTEVLGP